MQVQVDKIPKQYIYLTIYFLHYREFFNKNSENYYHVLLYEKFIQVIAINE